MLIYKLKKENEELCLPLPCLPLFKNNYKYQLINLINHFFVTVCKNKTTIKRALKTLTPFWPKKGETVLDSLSKDKNFKVGHLRCKRERDLAKTTN